MMRELCNVMRKPVIVSLICLLVVLTASCTSIRTRGDVSDSELQSGDVEVDARGVLDEITGILSPYSVCRVYAGFTCRVFKGLKGETCGCYDQYGVPHQGEIIR